MVRCLIGTQGNRPAQKCLGPCGIAALKSRQPQQVQRVGMVRFRRQDRLVVPGGLLNPALPVELDRFLQNIGHGLAS